MSQQGGKPINVQNRLRRPVTAKVKPEGSPSLGRGAICDGLEELTGVFDTSTRTVLSSSRIFTSRNTYGCSPPEGLCAMIWYRRRLASSGFKPSSGSGTCTHTHIYIYIYIYIYIHRYIHIHTCTHIYMHAHTHADTHAHMHTQHTQPQPHTYIHTRTHTRARQHIHAEQ